MTIDLHQKKSIHLVLNNFIQSYSVAYFLVKYIPPKCVFWGKGGKVPAFDGHT